MTQSNKQSGRLIAIITMMFIYAMISFVTNLAAPVGVIWKSQPELAGSNALGMMGNMMNFFAYLFMGIPAGKLLVKIGYKKTALTAIAVGFIGILVQFISGKVPGISGFIVYLLGAFICGFCVCMLNTVVNPMLNLLGGGGNKGNQLNLVGGTLNSLAGTLTPLLVGSLVGTVTAETAMKDVNPVLFIAMGVFAAAFIVLSFIPIKDPEQAKVTKETVFERSPWAFRHCVLGIVGIFVYVGIEIGIPGTLNFYISDTTERGCGALIANAAAVGGCVAATYWLLMLVGRFLAALVAAKVSSRQMMIGVSSIAIILMLIAMFSAKTTTVSMPVFTGSAFEMVTVPVAALLLVLCGLCTSVMWSSIFNLATEGLGKYTAAASGLFMMMVVGGGVLPLIQNFVADKAGYMVSYIVPLLALAYLLYYGLIGCKNVNKDIKVD